jgi:hypothetical protein
MTFQRDFDRVHLLADSGALDRVRAAGFDGIAIYDAFVRPTSWAGLAHGCRDLDLLFSFNINDGFDGIAQRDVPAGSCYRPTPFEPSATLNFASPTDREWATLYAKRRMDESLSTTLGLQVGQSRDGGGPGFFLVYINTFNEWHEGTAIEPMKNRADLSAAELPFGYHNPADGSYRLEYLSSRLGQLFHG